MNKSSIWSNIINKTSITITNWPKIGQEVKDKNSNKIGIVNEVKIINNIEKALIEWGLYESWVAVNDLKEIDS